MRIVLVTLPEPSTLAVTVVLIVPDFWLVSLFHAFCGMTTSTVRVPDGPKGDPLKIVCPAKAAPLTVALPLALRITQEGAGQEMVTVVTLRLFLGTT